MKKIIILLITLGITGIGRAQSFEEAVRFSRHTNSGTARSAAMGGAFAALGGDISAISSNPAGIGVFRKSEVGFTPYMNFGKTKASEKQTAYDNSFQLGDLGAVFSFYSPSFDWKGINFGINYTNLNNFNRKTNQSIGYSENSWLDVLAAASGTTNSDDLDPYSTGLAYDTWLINGNPDKTKGGYLAVLKNNEPVAQTKRIKEDGYQGEYAFSFGTNYKDKLYLGLTIGLQSIYYKMTSTYQEAPDLNTPSGLDYYNYDEYRQQNGVGTNLKFGVIYRPLPEIRIGAAIHTPTWYNMNYKTSSAMSSSFWTETDDVSGRNGYDFYARSQEFSVDYNMRTPWRAIVGAAAVIKQKAIISADYEYIKYKDANFSEGSDGYDYQYENDLIKDYLRPTHNFRAGAEYRFNSLFSLRAGYSFWDSPYHNDNDKSDNRTQSISGGVGLNFGTFYCDAAYVYKYSKDQTIFYDDFDIQSAISDNKYIGNEARITFGVRF